VAPGFAERSPNISDSLIEIRVFHGPIFPLYCAAWQIFYYIWWWWLGFAQARFAPLLTFFRRE